jgi:hypothetical protein
MPEHLKRTKDTIERRGDKYVLLSAAGDVLGEHDSEEAARAQERAIKAAKALRDTADSEDWVDTVDFAPFSKVDSRDANGFLRVSATVTKPGVYAYVRDGKIRHELKPESEIFAPVHMESVHGAVVTSEHPPGAVAVTPENSKKFQRGHSMSAPTRTADGLDVDLVVTDQTLIDDAESGRRTGVSEGMRNTFDHTPGVWTAPDGSKHPYDVIQTNMVANHLAIVSTPRVTSAQLHLDSLEQDGPQDNHTMENQGTLTIDGADFQIDANIAKVAMASIARKDGELKALQAKLDEATTSNDSLTEEKDKLTEDKDKALAERDAVSAERDTLKTKVETADAVDINELVTKRQEFLVRAQSVMSADSFEEVKGGTDKEIMKAACEKSGTKMTQDSDVYVHVLFDTLVSQAATTNDSKLMNASLTMPAVTPTQASERTSLNDRLSKHRAGSGQVAH